MKTAETWSTSIANKFLKQRPLVWPSDVLDTVKQIQLDAMKEGMRRAADMKPNMVQEKCYGETESAWGQGYNAGTAAHCSAILTAAEQLTEKDLCSALHVANPSNQKE